MPKSRILRGSWIVFYGSLEPLQNEELLCDCHQLLVKSLSQVNGRSHQSSCYLVRYLDRSIKIDFSGDRQDLGEVNFTCTRGLFVETGMPVTISGRRLHTLEKVLAVL